MQSAVQRLARALVALSVPAALALCTDPLRAQDWQLIWSDEFSGEIRDEWVFEIGNGVNGWGNNELEYYRQENATVENGMLVITARRQSFEGFDYTSARMKTQGNFSVRYGRIEARIALPSVQGLWPAFWMLGSNITTVGWPACGEIDIMEHVNTDDVVHGTIHWDVNGHAFFGNSISGVDIGAFHVYAIEWDEAEIRWYVDDVQYNAANILDNINSTEEFHRDFFILLNLAVGGNFPGFDIDDSGLPARMLVDYVRVFQDGGVPDPPGQSPFGGSPALIPGTIEAEAFDNGGESVAYHDADAGNNGGAFRTGEAVDLEASSEHDFNVGWIETDEWLEYTVNVATTATYDIDVRVASLSAGGTFHIELDGVDVTGSHSFPATGDWQSWSTHTITGVGLSAGEQVMRFYAESPLFNVNFFEFREAGSAPCVTLHSTDFESGPSGWFHSSADSTCSTGNWVVGNPDGVVNGGVTTQLEDDRSSPGVNAFFTQPNGGGAGTDDVDGGVCTALSPIVDASGHSSAEVALWYYHGQRDQGDDPSGDFFRIDLSTDGGSSFPIALVSIGDQTTQAAWTSVTRTIDSPAQLRLRVQASDGSGPGDLVEAGLDEIVICGIN